MVSRKTLKNSGEAASYYKVIARGAEAARSMTDVDQDYYSSKPLEWFGKTAKLLGLDGHVSEDAFISLLDGYDPRKPDKRLVAVRKDGKRRCGWDFCFSAPKGFSIMAELHPKQAIRNSFYEMHERAVKDTLAHIERNLIEINIGHGRKARQMKPGNIAGALATENTSRELDPQVHTHCVIFNLTKFDGKWKSLWADSLFYLRTPAGRMSFKHYAGQIYRNYLAHSLRESGFDIEQLPHGLFDVKGVPDDLKQQYSKRSQQIKSDLNELRLAYPGLTDPELKEMANLRTRKGKADVSPARVRHSWHLQRERLGYSKGDIQRFQKLPDRRGFKANAAEMALNILMSREAVVSPEEIYRQAMCVSMGHKTVDDVREEFEKCGEKRTLVPGFAIMSRVMQMLERGMVARIRVTQDTQAPILSEKEIEKNLSEYLTGSQRRGASHILTSKDMLTFIQGDPGTGKTAMSEIVKNAAERKSYEVIGLAPTGKAAAEQQKVGIASKTIDSFLLRPRANGKKRLFLVDESSMIGIEKMSKLLSRVRDGDKLVLVGDVKQKPSIAAGEPFQSFQGKGIVNAEAMTHNIRQRSPGAISLARKLSGKMTDAAVKVLKSQNWLHEIADRSDRIEAVCQEYVRDPEGTVVVTESNWERDKINSRIREILVERGDVQKGVRVKTLRPQFIQEPQFAFSYQKGDIVTVNEDFDKLRAGDTGKIVMLNQDRHAIVIQTPRGEWRNIQTRRHGHQVSVSREEFQWFAPGDPVIFRKNDSKFGFQNGQTAKVIGIDSMGNMAVRFSDDRRSKFNLYTSYNHVELAYAVTGMSAQGMTVERRCLYSCPSELANFNNFATAGTRARHETQVFTDSAEHFQKAVKHEIVKTTTLDYPFIDGNRHVA